MVHDQSSPFLSDTQDDEITPIPIPSHVGTPQENSHTTNVPKIPVTLFTGYLGAGKTTIITNLIKSVPKNYKIAWLKNEIGNTAVDSELARQTNVATVKEILKGCLCHYMIGSLNSALDEILLSQPDRIVIETSGSAAPAPIVWEIRKNPRLLVDGVITIIDAINFTGYINKSFALKMQAKYTDLILINKHEGMDEQTLDKHLDDLYEINLDTPKIKTDQGFIDPNIVFGLDSTLFLTQSSVTKEEKHFLKEHQDMEADLIEITPQATYETQKLINDLKKFPKNKFYRIKGIVNTDSKPTILNCAFGACTLTPINKKNELRPRIVMMGEDLMEYAQLISDVFHIHENNLHYTPKRHVH